MKGQSLHKSIAKISSHAAFRRSVDVYAAFVMAHLRVDAIAVFVANGVRGRVCVRVREHACVRACVCMRECVRVRKHSCVHARVCVCICV